MNAAAAQGNQGQNAAPQVNHVPPFLQWRQGVQLADFEPLYFGVPAVICTPVGRRYLRSAFCFAITQFEAGMTWRGGFTDLNFLSNNGLFGMNIPPIQSLAGSGFSDLLLDLVALCNGLLGHYRLGGVPALFTDHLQFLVMNPRPVVFAAGVFQTRFIKVVRYHFSYSSPAALRGLFSSLADVRQHLSHFNVRGLDNLVRTAWRILGMSGCPIGLHWVSELMYNPVFYEILHNTVRYGRRAIGYQSNNSISLFRFGRNDEVHAPEKTLGFLPAVPVQPTPPPAGIDNWQYVYDPAHGTWGWQPIPAQGQWNWPSVPTNQNWQNLLSNATQGLAPIFPPQAPVPPVSLSFNQTYNNQVRQQMDSPDQPSLMLWKTLGIFYAHASALILIELQTSSPEFIEKPFNLYASAMDSETPISDP